MRACECRQSQATELRDRKRAPQTDLSQLRQLCLQRHAPAPRRGQPAVRTCAVPTAQRVNMLSVRCGTAA
eukprot:2927742-Pleurochrysis_carterae.AAC.5